MIIMSSVLSKKDSIFVASYSDMVGSAIVCQLENWGFINMLTESRNNVDLTDQSSVVNLFNVSKLNAMDWKYQTNLKTDLKKTYAWYLVNVDSIGLF